MFARRGISLRDFGSYRQAGVNMGIGTDVYPHNMVDEMRLAAYVARVVAKTRGRPMPRIYLLRRPPLVRRRLGVTILGGSRLVPKPIWY